MGRQKQRQPSHNCVTVRYTRVSVYIWFCVCLLKTLRELERSLAIRLPSMYSKFWPKGGLPGILHHYVCYHPDYPHAGLVLK